MAISAAGQALAQKNKANRQEFNQATTIAPAPVVTPANPVTDKFTKENFLKMSGTTPTSTPTPLGTTNTSEGLNIGGGVKNPLSIIQPGNTTGELPNTTITQTSGQTGVNSPFASGNKTNTTTPTTPTTPTQTVEGSVADSIANANKAIADEKAGLKSVQDATKDAISTAAASKEALIGAEEKFARDKALLNQQKMSDLQLSQAEYVNEQERQKTEAITTIQPLVDAERAANRAALNVAAAKAEEGEYNATVANDVAMQQANVAFAKMGMSFTGSAIATTQSLHKEGALKIASLKADNAYKYAGLQKEMNAVEVNHQIKVNSIIATANENIVAKREKTRDKISAIQENVIMTEKEKVQNIEKIKNEYADFRLKSETTVYGQVRDSNKEVQRNLDAITAKLDKDKVDAKAQIQSLVRNGQWDKLSATKQKELSTRSGMSIGEVEGEKTSAVYAAVNTQLQAIVGSNITVSPESSKKIFDAASAYVSMGYNINTAIQKAIQLNASKIPEIAQSKQLETRTNSLKLSQAEANLNQTNANINQTLSNTRINETKSNLEVNKAKAEASAAKNPWTTSGVDVDGYVIQSNKDTGAIRKVRPEEFKTSEQWASTKGAGLLDAPDGTIIPSRLSDSGNPNGGKACGEFANDATGRINVGQLATQRKEAFTDTNAKVGGQVFFEGDGYDPKYGHVAVVTGVSADGKTMTIKESNRTGNGEVGERTIPTSQATGFYNNTDLAKTAETKGVRMNISEMTISGKNDDLANTVLNEFGITNADTVTKDAALAVINNARKQGLSPNEAKAGVRDVLKNSGLLSPLKTMSEGELAAINSPDDYVGLFRKFSEASKVDRDILKRDLNTLTDNEGNLLFGGDIGSSKVGQYYIEPTYDAEFKPDGGFEIKKKTQSEDEWFSTEDDGESVMIIPPKTK